MNARTDGACFALFFREVCRIKDAMIAISVFCALFFLEVERRRSIIFFLKGVSPCGCGSLVSGKAVDDSDLPFAVACHLFLSFPLVLVIVFDGAFSTP